MLTLSTFPNDTAGYTLFVDGQPVRFFSLKAQLYLAGLAVRVPQPRLDPCMQPYQLEQTMGSYMGMHAQPHTPPSSILVCRRAA